MKTQHHIEHYGHLEKCERLETLTKSILPHTLVFEAPEPFSGCSKYYGEMPRNSKPLYVYVVLDDSVDLAKFARAHQKVLSMIATPFSGAFTIVSFQNYRYNAIRLRHLEGFDQIPVVQEAYQKMGLKLSSKAVSYNGDAHLTFKKLFQLDDLGDGFFLDLDEKDHGYFQVPNHLDKDPFMNLVQKVKNNTDLQNFDFACAFFYTNNTVLEVIRAYSPTMTEEVLRRVSHEFLSRWPQ